jgi:transposase
MYSVIWFSKYYSRSDRHCILFCIKIKINYFFNSDESPDLNPIEYTWDEVKRQIKDRKFFHKLKRFNQIQIICQNLS